MSILVSCSLKWDLFFKILNGGAPRGGHRPRLGAQTSAGGDHDKLRAVHRQIWLILYRLDFKSIARFILHANANVKRI